MTFPGQWPIHNNTGIINSCYSFWERGYLQSNQWRGYNLRSTIWQIEERSFMNQLIIKLYNIFVWNIEARLVLCFSLFKSQASTWTESYLQVGLKNCLKSSPKTCWIQNNIFLFNSSLEFENNNMLLEFTKERQQWSTVLNISED